VRGFSVRIQATNVFDTPQWSAIDTVATPLGAGRRHPPDAYGADRPADDVLSLPQMIFQAWS
jgi:hypothetical protein